MTMSEVLMKVMAATVVVCLLLAQCSLSQLTFTPGWRTRILVKERSTRSGGLTLNPAGGMSKRQNGDLLGHKNNDEMILANAGTGAGATLFSEHAYDPWMVHASPMHAPDRAVDAFDNGENELYRACALLRDHITRMMLFSSKKEVVLAQLQALWEQVCAERLRAPV